jgi:hypothetical protein
MSTPTASCDESKRFALGTLRRFALNVLRANRTQGSTRGKIKRAGWDDAFLLNLLASA